MFPSTSEIRTALAAMPAQTVPAMRVLRRHWSRHLESAPPHAVLELAERLTPAGDWERLVAYELVAYHPGAMRALTPRRLRVLGRGMNSWGHVDTFACYLAGPAWREGQVPDAVVQAWCRSDDLWWRRAALACTVALNVPARGGRGDAARTLSIVTLLLQDREDMVVKAVSWALRALAQRDPKSVKAFLAKHDEALAPRVKREVETKLRTGKKTVPKTAKKAAKRR
jgi:3-methyladenine DNA glycosylase AlkD